MVYINLIILFGQFSVFQAYAQIDLITILTCSEMKAADHGVEAQFQLLIPVEGFYVEILASPLINFFLGSTIKLKFLKQSKMESTDIINYIWSWTLKVVNITHHLLPLAYIFPFQTNIKSSNFYFYFFFLFPIISPYIKIS